MLKIEEERKNSSTRSEITNHTKTQMRMLQVVEYIQYCSTVKTFQILKKKKLVYYTSSRKLEI